MSLFSWAAESLSCLGFAGYVSEPKMIASHFDDASTRFHSKGLRRARSLSASGLSGESDYGGGPIRLCAVDSAPRT